MLLVEYVEVVLPMVYCEYLRAYCNPKTFLSNETVCVPMTGAHHYIVYNLHNRAYYPMLESLAPSEFISTLSHVLIYSSLEFVSLLVSIVVLKRTLGFSSLRQLSFVLENQAGIIQGKLLIHLIYIMQISLVHIGKCVCGLPDMLTV